MKTYNSPMLQVVSIKRSDIIATSTRNLGLGASGSANAAESADRFRDFDWDAGYYSSDYISIQGTRVYARVLFCAYPKKKLASVSQRLQANYKKNFFLPGFLGEPQLLAKTRIILLH